MEVVYPLKIRPDCDREMKIAVVQAQDSACFQWVSWTASLVEDYLAVDLATTRTALGRFQQCLVRLASGFAIDEDVMERSVDRLYVRRR